MMSVGWADWPEGEMMYFGLLSAEEDEACCGRCCCWCCCWGSEEESLAPMPVCDGGRVEGMCL